jgi:hypothetical protein
VRLAAPRRSSAPQALHALEVARQHVDLEIELIARLQRAERGHFGGVRDQVQRELTGAVGLVSDLVDGQRDAIDRDRSLGGEIGRQLARDRNADPPRIPLRADADYFVDDVVVGFEDAVRQPVVAYPSGVGRGVAPGHWWSSL